MSRLVDCGMRAALLFVLLTQWAPTDLSHASQTDQAVAGDEAVSTVRKLVADGHHPYMRWPD